MSTEMDWSHDYCLSCDRQLSEGAYCSQACRLADLENASHSGPNSPLSTSASSTASYVAPMSNTTTANAHSHSGFCLPPAVNFSTYNRSAPRSNSYPQQSSPSTQYYNYYSIPSPTHSSYAFATQDALALAKRLSTSSSNSSLASASGNQSAPGLSPQAASALQGYVSSFDQVRETKRRYRS